MKKNKASFGRKGGGEGQRARSILVAWFPPVIWSITIFYFSSIPGDAIYLPPFLLMDKLIHLVVYGVLAFLVARGCREMQWGKKAYLFGTSYSLLYGLLDEIHQSFVPGRFADPYDMIADVIGVVLGLWLYGRYYLDVVE